MSKTTFAENDLPETAEVTGNVEEIYNPENKDSIWFELKIQAAHSRDFSRELAAFKDHFFRKISYKNQLLFKKNNILKV